MFIARIGGLGSPVAIYFACAGIGGRKVLSDNRKLKRLN
jgi:hypothetical protein